MHREKYPLEGEKHDPRRGTPLKVAGWGNSEKERKWQHITALTLEIIATVKLFSEETA